MAALKKIMITPYFGEKPEWFDKFECPKGYDWLLDTDLDGFTERVSQKLGIHFPGRWGGGKVWDYRCALGLIYEDVIRDYNYWGHMDLDVVWGDMDHFLPDKELSEVDVYSSHHEYVCGCFSVYKNSAEVNNLFKRYPDWTDKMIYGTPTGWVETEYSRLLESSGLKYAYDFQQGNPWDKNPVLKKDNSRLYQLIDNNWKEIMFFHFRHSKKWPL